MLRLTVTAALLMTAPIATAELPAGKAPPQIVLDGDTGGKVTGDAWASEDIRGKVGVLFYVAPSEKDLNKAASDAIKARDYDKDRYQTYAVVNMAASWWPNAMIESKIKASQKEFPRTIYVKDKRSVLVKQWNLKDDSNDVVVFAPDGTVAFSKDGKLSEQDIAQMLAVLDKYLKVNAAPAPVPAAPVAKSPAPTVKKKA